MLESVKRMKPFSTRRLPGISATAVVSHTVICTYRRPGRILIQCGNQHRAMGRIHPQLVLRRLGQ